MEIQWCDMPGIGRNLYKTLDYLLYDGAVLNC